jgi:hypothetical protein
MNVHILLQIKNINVDSILFAMDKKSFGHAR